MALPLRRPGILIYWHVERGSMVVHSQTLRASASEVHAMVEGAIRHCTTMKVQANYVDTHGRSEIGFGITRLLGFDLLPRPAAPDQADQQDPALPPGGGAARRLSVAHSCADSADSVGSG